MGCTGETEVVVRAEAAAHLDSRLEVFAAEGKVQKDQQDRWRQSGIYDVRVFRDGQLLGWAPRSSTAWQARSSDRGYEPDGVDLADWRQAHEVKVGRPEVDLPSQLTPRQGRAYVISIGVNRTRSTPA